MTYESAHDSLLDQIELIESQPLDQRAAGFDRLAQQLQEQLQSGDTVPSDDGEESGEYAGA